MLYARKPIFSRASFALNRWQLVLSQPRVYMGSRNADCVVDQYLSEILVNGLIIKRFMFVGPDTICIHPVIRRQAHDRG